MNFSFFDQLKYWKGRFPEHSPQPLFPDWQPELHCSLRTGEWWYPRRSDLFEAEPSLRRDIYCIVSGDTPDYFAQKGAITTFCLFLYTVSITLKQRKVNSKTGKITALLLYIFPVFLFHFERPVISVFKKSNLFFGIRERPVFPIFCSRLFCAERSTISALSFIICSFFALLSSGRYAILYVSFC